MSGKVPAVGGLGGGVGVALLPNTGGSRLLFWVAIVALVAGITTMVIGGLVAYKQRTNQ